MRQHADGRPQVVAVGTHEERRAGGDADALSGEGDDGGPLVADPHPQVDAVGAGDVDTVVDEHVRDGPATFGVGGAGVRQRRVRSPDGGSARAAPIAGCGSTSRARAGGGSRPPSRRCRRRRPLRGAGPARGSWRSCGCARCVRATRRRRWSAAPRRSRWRGRPRRRPWRVGRRTSAIACARRADIATPAGFCARGCSITAAGSPAATTSRSWVTSSPSSSTSTPMTSHDSRSSRSSIGGNPGCSTTTRSPRRSTTLATRSRASRAPSTTVIASGENGHVARNSSSSAGSTGWSR